MNQNNLKTPLLGFGLILSALMLTGCNLGEFAAKNQPEEEQVMMEKNETANVTKDEKKVMATHYQAGKVQAFNQATYEKAKAEGETILLDFSADWCPVCQANKPRLKSAVEANGNIVAFEANYDTEKALKKNYNVTTQTTYILIKDGKEVDRTIGSKTEAQFAKFIGETTDIKTEEESQAMMIKEEVNKEKEKVVMEKKYQSGIQNYNEAAFAAAIADGKTVALDFHANWCSVCLGNKPKLEAAVNQIGNDELVVFIADYDTERSLKKDYNVQSQATYLLIKNGKESNRLTGPKTTDEFKAFLES